jgi:hypothetical protein
MLAQRQSVMLPRVDSNHQPFESPRDRWLVTATDGSPDIFDGRALVTHDYVQLVSVILDD